MSLRALRLDFLQAARRRSGGGGVVLLAAGVAMAFVVLSFYGDLKGETEQLASQAARLERRARGLAPVAPPVDALLEQEIRRVNEVIDQLALPWDRVFHAVEGAAAERVVLLGIVPDAKSGMVQISAQAADAEAMFDYVKGLEQQRELSQVYLLQHQHQRQKTLWPLRFLVSASWMPR